MKHPNPHSLNFPTLFQCSMLNADLTTLSLSFLQNNGAQQLASEATIYIVLDDVNDEIPLFTEREQETVLEGEPPGTKVTQVNAIDKDGTFPNKQGSGREGKMQGGKASER